MESLGDEPGSAIVKWKIEGEIEVRRRFRASAFFLPLSTGCDFWVEYLLFACGG